MHGDFGKQACITGKTRVWASGWRSYRVCSLCAAYRAHPYVTRYKADCTYSLSIFSAVYVKLPTPALPLISITARIYHIVRISNIRTMQRLLNVKSRFNQRGTHTCVDARLIGPFTSYCGPSGSILLDEIFKRSTFCVTTWKIGAHTARANIVADTTKPHPYHRLRSIGTWNSAPQILVATPFHDAPHPPLVVSSPSQHRAAEADTRPDTCVGSTSAAPESCRY